MFTKTVDRCWGGPKIRIFHRAQNSWQRPCLEARAKALPAIHAMEMEEAALKSKTAALKSRRETIELQSEIEDRKSVV